MRAVAEQTRSKSAMVIRLVFVASACPRRAALTKRHYARVARVQSNFN
jgi:hypothetical protein